HRFSLGCAATRSPTNGLRCVLGGASPAGGPLNTVPVDRTVNVGQRWDSARARIRPGSAVTVKHYAKRYDVDRTTACDDLTALAFALPDSARQWARPCERSPVCRVPGQPYR